MVTKVLIIRFSSIGDIVLTSPVIRCLKQQSEGEIEIHYLVKEVFSPVLAANPYISKIHTIDDKVSEVISALKDEQFDYMIDLHNNIRSAMVKKGSAFGGKRRSFTVNKINFQKWLLVNFKINRLPNVHIVDRYMETVKYLGIENDNKGLDYFIPNEDEIDLLRLPPSHQNGYVGFAIGGKHATKRLPLDKIISICKKIGKPIVLLGSDEDKERAIRIEESVGDTVYNACGKYNINQSASLIRQAEKIITHDTGLMHIAAAFKKDVISIWGNTVPEFGMYPYVPQEPPSNSPQKGGERQRAESPLNIPHGKGKSKIIEVQGLSCRPCSKIGYDRCPKGHFKCMNLIDDEEIIERVLSVP